MAADRNGNDLAAGDMVTVLCRVVAACDPSNVCDVHLETDEGAHKNGAGKLSFMVAGRQVAKVVAVAESAIEPDEKPRGKKGHKGAE